MGGCATELLTFAHHLASKDFSVVDLEVDRLLCCPVFVEGVEVLPIIVGVGETLASHYCIYHHHDRVLIADRILRALYFALCVLQRLDVVGDGVGREVYLTHLVLQVDQVDHMEASACRPGGLEKFV